MGKEQSNMEIHHHPEAAAGVTVVLHWGVYGIDAKVTLPSPRWREIVEQTTLAPRVGAMTLLAAAGVQVPPSDHAAVVEGFGASLRALLAL